MFTSSSKIKLCAWAKDTDTCQGDSGGPLTVPENGQIFTLSYIILPVMAVPNFATPSDPTDP